ncbi:MAG: hypothetical protein HYY24_23010 [Verrucomicrobia bacterium]|nr:hypothetical protein [Verrucomicrobiota bacterium]
MKREIFLSAFIISSAVLGCGQGIFAFVNDAWGEGARTRLGSIDGPLAGSSISAQMLVGPASDSLSPILPVARHIFDGMVRGVGTVTVPGFLPGDTVFVQMVAWDSIAWGASLASVPVDQLGRTDIVSVRLGSLLIGAPPVPFFTKPAIVPPIPEPSSVALALVGAFLWVAVRFSRPRRGGATTSSAKSPEKGSSLLTLASFSADPFLTKEPSTASRTSWVPLAGRKGVSKVTPPLRFQP